MNKNIIISFGKMILFLICSMQVEAQNLSNYQWIFGSKPNVQSFDYTTKKVDLNVDGLGIANFGTNQSLIVNDSQSGTLQFYTDGINIYNSNNQIMPNGIGIEGDNVLLYGVAALQSETNDKHYGVFTVKGNNLYYSLVNMSLQGGSLSAVAPFGDVSTVLGRKNQIVTNESPVGVLLPIYSASSRKNFILGQNRTNNELFVYSVNSTHQFSKVATHTIDYTISSADAFEVSAGLIRIVLGAKDLQKNIKTIDFDINLTPPAFVIASEKTLANTSVNNGSTEFAIYSVQFSSSGQNLYISIFGNDPTTLTGSLLKYNFISNSVTSILTSNLYRSYGLKKGPNNIIYHLFKSTMTSETHIGAIQKPDGDGNNVEYLETVFVGKNLTGTIFPQTVISQKKSPLATELGFDTHGGCEKKNVVFSPTYPADNIPISFSWDFGDGNMSNKHIPLHSYSAAGTYNVKLTLTFVSGAKQVIDKSITISADTNSFQFPDDTTLCKGETLTLDAKSPTAIWNTGVTGQTLVVDKPGLYYAIVNNGTCISYDEIKIKYYGDDNKVANIWHFGTKAGIDFNQNPPVTSANSNVVAPAGVATMSDENGNLLFYTNGEVVWDKEHTVMPNGSALGGQKESSQSVIIVPVPEDNTLFYVFTTKDVYGDGTNVLAYSLIDLKLNSFKGDVVIKNKALFSKSTEKIAANSIKDNTWLISHEFGNDVFRSYQLTKEGLFNVVKSNVGTVHHFSVANNGKGYIKFDSKSELVAVTVPTNKNVEIFDFDSKTGKLDNMKSLDINPTATGYPYGLEWSSDSKRLFVSILNDNIVQEWSFAGSTNRKIDDITIPSDVGALQMGPDGNIYVAKNTATSLGVIQINKANVNAPSTYNDTGIQLASGSTSSLGLPNFIQSISSPQTEPQFTVSNACAGTMTMFSATGTSDIDVFNWTFGDGGKSSEQNPTYQYAKSGTYKVTVNIANRCGYVKVLERDIVVGTAPNLPDTETLRLCSPMQTIAVGPNLDSSWTYDWTFPDGSKATTSTVDISLEGKYTIIVSSPDGCSKTIEKNVINTRPSFDLGVDRAVCVNSVSILNAQNPTATSYVWKKNGVVITSATGRTLEVDTQTVEIATYEVTVTMVNNGLSCSATDEIMISVIALPILSNVTSSPASSCGVSNGLINFNIGASTNTFSYKLELGTTEVSDVPSVNSGAYSINNLAAGNYTLTVSNEATQCEVVQRHINISDSGGFLANPVLPLNFTSCLVSANGNKVVFDMRDSNNNPLDTFDNIWISGPVGSEGFQTRIMDNEGNQLQKDIDYFQSSDASNSQFIIAGLTEGTYSITFTSPITSEATTSVTSNGVTQNIVTTPLRPAVCTTTVNITLTNSAEKLSVEVFSVNDGAIANAIACQPIGLSVQFKEGATPLTAAQKVIDPNLYKFNWTSETATFSASNTFKEVGVVTKGTHRYKLRVSDRTGKLCPGEDDIMATVLDPLDFEIQQNEALKGCDGTMELTSIIKNAIAGEHFIYEWTLVDGTTRTQVASTQTLTIDTSNLSAQVVRNYQLSIISNLRGTTCITPISKQITLLPELLVKLSNALACDDGQPFQINTFINRTDLTKLIYKWKLNGQPINQTTKSISVTKGGNYELEVLEFRDLTDNTPKCSRVATLNINLTPIPIITLPATSKIICPLDSDPNIKQVDINSIPAGFSIYTWTKSGELVSNDKDLIITKAGIYKIEAETVTGCSSRATIEVFEDCQPILKTPTAFTPNKNNKNDDFLVFTKYVTDFSISIINHWGEVIYTSIDKDFRWNGRYNGTFMPAGSYNYIIEYSSNLDKNKAKYSKQGGVVLVR